jgi:hypothetical protein
MAPRLRTECSRGGDPDRVPGDERDAEDVLKAAIRSHLRGALHAADTARGVADWWVPPPAAPISEDLFERVLEQLVDSGDLERRILPDRSVLYLAHRDHK